MTWQPRFLKLESVLLALCRTTEQQPLTLNKAASTQEVIRSDAVTRDRKKSRSGKSKTA